MGYRHVGDATLTVGSLTTQVVSVELDVTMGTVDINDSSTSGWTKVMGKHKKWSGSIEINLVDGKYPTVDTGDIATLTLTYTSGQTKTGTVVITGVNTPVPIGDEAVLTATITFEGTGTLT